jgi:maleamate amidohydrolase
MTEDWRQALPGEERDTYALGGFGQQTAPGAAVAVVVIDATYGFVGRPDLSDAENHHRYPNWCGPSAWEAVEQTRSLIAAAAENGRPLVETVGMPAGNPKSPWRRKHGRLTDRQDDDVRLVRTLESSAARVLPKYAPSAFFGTDLAHWLRERGVTDVLVGGCTTSGCVRATVVDSFSHGFDTFVVSECVFDRAATSHAVSLFEMDQKYATVISLENALEALTSTPDGRPNQMDLGCE